MNSAEPSADPELWAALHYGVLLVEILEDFYSRVYEDSQLGPFFTGTDPNWIQQKQYSFLRSKFSGEALDFRSRPRDANHWMVIPDDLVGYRDSIMQRCLRDAGLSEHLIERWLTYERVFRRQIVKSETISLKIGGIALSNEGYEPMIAPTGSHCHGCQHPIDSGDAVQHHTHSGEIFCHVCMPVPLITMVTRVKTRDRKPYWIEQEANESVR